MSIVVGKEARIHSTDSNTVIEIPTPSEQLEQFYPFKIYQPTNFKDFDTGFAFDPITYDLVDCLIDSNIPTVYPYTVNPDTDAWRFWAIRAGQVEIRPIYTLISDATVCDLRSPNNYGWKFDFGDGCDGNSQYGSIIEPYTEFDTPTTKTKLPPLILPDPISGDFTNPYIAFYLWIQIVPDTQKNVLPYAKIQGYMGTNVFAANQIPVQGKYTIPIGTIDNNNSFDGGVYHLDNFTVDQFIFDNQVNLFPKGGGNFLYKDAFSPDGSTSLNYRGFYRSAGTSWPLDLKDQIMYPGDVVWFRDFSGFDTLCIWSNNPATFYADPYYSTWKIIYGAKNSF